MRLTEGVRFFPLSAVALVLAVSAASGSSSRSPLDRSFGVRGKVTTRIGENSDASAASLQPDGKLVVIGTSWTGGNYDLALARYRRSGSLDTGFGRRGLVTTDFGSSYDEASAGAVLRDGKILVAGSTSHGTSGGLALARYLPSGSLDKSFGTDGRVIVPDCGARALLPQSNGKLLVGSGSNHGVVLCRLNPDGSLDTTFGAGGRVTTDFGFGFGTAVRSLVLQADGRIVAAGTSFGHETSQWAIARYLPDGRLDETFGAGGKLQLFAAALTGTYVAAIGAQSGGKIVVVGNGDDGRPTLIRLDRDGSLDPEFGKDGVAKPWGLVDWYPTAMHIGPDDKIVVAGGTWGGGTDGGFALVRFRSDGALDHRFWDAGQVVTQIGPHHDIANALVVRRDGKLVLVGTAQGPAPNGEPETFALARYLPPFTCRVPSVQGLRLAQARRALTRAGCATGRIERVTSAYAKRGRVIAQLPRAGVRAPELTPVRLVVSLGRPR